MRQGGDRCRRVTEAAGAAPGNVEGHGRMGFTHELPGLDTATCVGYSRVVPAGVAR